MRKQLTATIMFAFFVILLGCESSVSSTQATPTEVRAEPATSRPTVLIQPSVTATLSLATATLTPPTLTSTPEPLGRLISIEIDNLLQRASGLEAIETVNVEPSNLPEGLVPGSFVDGEQVVTVAQDAQGNKVFIFTAYPASIRQANNPDEPVGGTFDESALVARYLQPTGLPFYYVPILSLRTSGLDTVNLPFTESNWIDGVPALVIDSAYNTWYFWWRDKNGREQRHEAIIVAERRDLLARVIPLVGLLKIEGPNYTSNRILWDIEQENLVVLRSATLVSSIVPVRNVIYGGHNPDGLLGIIRDDGWRVSSRSAVDIASRTIEIAAIVATEPFEENEQLFFEVALPTTSGGTRLRVLLVPDFPYRIGYCPFRGWRYPVSSSCYATTNAPEIYTGLRGLDEVVTHLKVGNGVWFSVQIEIKLVTPLSSERGITEAVAETYCQDLDAHCVVRILLLSEKVESNKLIAQRITTGQDLSGLTIGPVGQMWIGGVGE